MSDTGEAVGSAGETTRSTSALAGSKIALAGSTSTAGDTTAAPTEALRPAALLTVRALAKHYGPAVVFRHADLDLAPGEVVAVLGESGVGKSTLLNIVAGLDAADAGRVVLDGIDLATLDDDGRAALRRERLGFVFQAFHVLPHLDVAHNVALPLMLLGVHDAAELSSRVDTLLEAVGLAGLGARAPRQLSGGQLQRVAIARALVHRPRLVLADEPTGNLDPVTAAQVFDLLLAQSREQGSACLIVTHSQAAAERADRRLRLTADGLQPD
jgi:putative ABC transport system ATP-binding protein